MRHKIWHAAFVCWYAHNERGHKVRAKVWGFAADTICRVFWPVSS